MLDAIAGGERLVAVRAPHGVGKLAPNSLILDTPKGPTRWGDLCIGNEVFGVDGKPTKITHVFPQGIQKIYRVTFDDGSSTLVGFDHLWKVDGPIDGPYSKHHWQILTTGEILSRGIKRQNTRDYQLRLWRVPLHGPAEFNSHEVPLDPYILGVWLGDGYGGSFTTTDIEISKRINSRTRYYYGDGNKMASPGAEKYRDRRQGQQKLFELPKWNMPIYGINKILKILGLSGCRSWEKFIPDLYKYNDPKKRLHLLRGLADTDGYCNKFGTTQFSSSSEQLANDFLWLVRSLGGKGSITLKEKCGYRKKKKFIQCRPSWIVTYRLPDGISSFYLKRKRERELTKSQSRYSYRFIESIEPEGEEEAMCIKVENEDGLYLTNDFIPTHNTSLCAMAAHWFLTTRYMSKVIVVAPTFGKQVKDQTFSEIHAWQRKSLLREIYAMTQTRMSIRGAEEVWFAQGVASDEADKIEGFHAPGGLMYVMDEAKGVAKGIWDAIRGAITGEEDILLAVSTPPLAPIGEFVRVFTELRTTWKTFAFGPTPRQSKQWRKAREKEWPKSSPEYISKVLGEIPKSSTDRTIVPLGLIEESMARKVTDEDLRGITRLGLDIARYGSDLTVLARLHGKVILPLETFSKQDTAITTALTIEILPLYDTLQIDEIGVGGGVVDALSHHPALKQKLVPVKNNAESPKPESYHDLGTYLWFAFVKWLEDGGILPNDDELASELATREFEWYYWHGRLSRKLVSKRDTAKHRQRSPDRADAVILAAIGIPRQVVAFLSQEDMDENERERQQEAIARAALQPRRMAKETVLVDDGPEQKMGDKLGMRMRRGSLNHRQDGMQRTNIISGKGFWRRGR